jgi:hypothetical protein
MKYLSLILFVLICFNCHAQTYTAENEVNWRLSAFNGTYSFVVTPKRDSVAHINNNRTINKFCLEKLRDRNYDGNILTNHIINDTTLLSIGHASSKVFSINLKTSKVSKLYILDALPRKVLKTFENGESIDYSSIPAIVNNSLYLLMDVPLSRLNHLFSKDMPLFYKVSLPINKHSKVELIPKPSIIQERLKEVKEVRYSFASDGQLFYLLLDGINQLYIYDPANNNWKNIEIQWHNHDVDYTLGKVYFLPTTKQLVCQLSSTKNDSLIYLSTNGELVKKVALPNGESVIGQDFATKKLIIGPIKSWALKQFYGYLLE